LAGCPFSTSPAAALGSHAPPRIVKNKKGTTGAEISASNPRQKESRLSAAFSRSVVLVSLRVD
jgi:hypothetical protein